jgi:hypothetical protein
MRVAPAFVLAVALAGLAGVGIGAAAADPEPIPLRLELTAPAGCPDANDFRREMERRGAATRTAGPGEKAGALRVEIAASDGARSVVARLAWIDDQGKASERRLEAPDCRAAESALALIAALALARGSPAADDANPGTTATAAGPTPAAAPELSPTPPPSPSSAPSPASTTPIPVAPKPVPSTHAAASTTQETAVATPATEPATSTAPTVSFSTTADGFVSLGSAPQPAFGVLALAGLAFERRAALGPIVVRAGIAAIPAHTTSIAGAPATFGTFAGLGEVCPVALHLLARVLVSPCVLGEFGTMNASGPNGENALARPWAAAGVEARASFALVGPFFLDASIDGLAAIDRNRFHVGDTLVYETPSAVGRFSMGLGCVVP